MVRYFSAVLLLLAVSVTPSRLLADAIASVTVQTDTRGLPGGSSCMLTSSGAEIECQSGLPNAPAIMQAAGSASAGVGSLSIFAAADGPSNNLARADASASYDYQIVFPGAYSGSITGEYALSINVGAPAGSYGELVISQANTHITAPVQDPPYPGRPLMLTSIYVPGQPFEIKGNVSATALAPEEVAYASVRLIGFFDPAGNPVPFTVVPEPPGWPVLGLGLVLVWRGKRIRWGDARGGYIDWIETPGSMVSARSAVARAAA